MIKVQGKRVLNELSAYKQGMQISEVKRNYNLDKIVKLASNENPYGFSDRVKKELNISGHAFELYPDGYAGDLRTKVANKLVVQPDQLVFGAGSDEVITFICRAYLSEGTNTVMATPTFSQYRHHSLIEGAEVREIPTVNGKHDLSKMAEAIDKQTKVVWLCSPDNPSGELIQQEAFALFMEQCPQDVLVVLDEAYYEYVPYSFQLNLNESLEKYPNLVVLRTFSKIYGLAGLRVGYGVASEEIAEKLNIVRGPFNTTSIAQKAIQIAIDDDEFVATTKKLNLEVKNTFKAFLDELGWEYYESFTNFLLVKTPIDADKTSHYLLKHGFIVRSGNLLGYPNTIRITIGVEKDMNDLQEVLTQFQKDIDEEVVK